MTGSSESMFLFWLGKTLVVLLLPPTGPVLLVVLGLLAMRRWRRFGRVLAWLGASALLVLSVPFVGAMLMSAVADAEALPPDGRVDAQAIAVLGCGVRESAPEYGTDTLTSMSLERVRYAATLARRLGLPVALSGGVVHDTRAEGDVMREVLEHEFGVKARWVESASRNTHENATGLRDTLQPEGIRKLVVVTHGVDTRRARRELRAAGFEVVMAPTVVPEFGIDTVWDVLPSIGGLRASYFALYEMLANVRASWNGIP